MQTRQANIGLDVNTRFRMQPCSDLLGKATLAMSGTAVRTPFRLLGLRCHCGRPIEGRTTAGWPASTSVNARSSLSSPMTIALLSDSARMLACLDALVRKSLRQPTPGLVTTSTYDRPAQSPSTIAHQRPVFRLERKLSQSDRCSRIGASRLPAAADLLGPIARPVLAERRDRTRSLKNLPSPLPGAP